MIIGRTCLASYEPELFHCRRVLLNSPLDLHSSFSEIALLIRLFRLFRQNVSRNVCKQFLVQNVIKEFGFRAYLLYTFKYSYIGIGKTHVILDMIDVCLPLLVC